MGRREVVTCRYCEVQFSVKPFLAKRVAFCSAWCRDESKRSVPIEERFDRKTVKHESGCWLWTGGTTNFGYGVFWNGQRFISAHRYSYTRHVGPIPAGLSLDHLCRTPGCVNPKHLEPVSHKENVRRGNATNKKTCRRGHLLTPDNLSPSHAKLGYRTCRQCIRDRRAVQKPIILSRQRERRHREREARLVLEAQRCRESSAAADTLGVVIPDPSPRETP